MISSQAIFLISAGCIFAGALFGLWLSKGEAEEEKVQIGGRAVPIKTTGARPLSNDYQTKRGVSVSRAAYTVPAGKQIEFQLAQPLNL